MDNSGKLAVDEILAAVGEMTADVKTLGVKTSGIIEHYGVKGMRWGVRRSRRERKIARGDLAALKEMESNSDRGGKTRSKREARKDAKRNPSEMSDAELRQRLNRMNMEKQYRELTAPKGGSLSSAGKKVAANVIKGVAQQTLTNVGQSYSTKYTAQYMANYKAPIPKPPILNPLRGVPKTPRLG